MKILITGITGFVGSWLSMYLMEMGHIVSGFGLRNDQKNHIFNKTRISKKINIKFFDIRDKDKTFNFVQSEKPDAIVHLAAQPLILNAQINPLETFEINILGTINIINSIHKLKVKKFINFTTDKVYGDTNKKNKFFKEDDFLFGSDIYPVSKICSDIISYSIYTNFSKHDWFNVRAGNIIGGGDYSANRLLPDYYNAYFSNKSLKIRQPNFVRPWQHVLEVSANLTKILQSKKLKSSNFNLGPKEEGIRPVREIIQIINKINNFKVKIKKEKLVKFNEQKYLFLNSNKFDKFFKYKKNISLVEELEMTNNWYLENSNSKDMFQFTKKQIHEYIRNNENNNNSNPSL